MNRSPVLLITSLLFLIAACGDPEPTGTVGGTKRGAARLLLARDHPEGPTGIEGSISFVSLKGEGETLLEDEPLAGPWPANLLGRSISDPIQIVADLEPGAYALSAIDRTCVANCEAGFDPPGETCTKEFTVAGGENAYAVAHMLPGGRCSIDVEVLPETRPVDGRVEVALWHCGIESPVFAGRVWRPEPVPFDGTNAPPEWAGEGRMRATQDGARYIDDGGIELTFVPMDPDFRYPLCD